ncbi:MAG: hypothetical protein N2508_13415 [Anaerolineae bacterium]|nr:hypothetical protein [Anaerolineae bacterium]
MNKLHLTGLAAIVVLLATLACGKGATPTPQPTPTWMPTNTPRPETAVPPTETPVTGASITIHNESGVDVWHIYISPSGAQEWGENWLKGDVIRAGSTYLITGIPEGRYDVMATDKDDNQIEVLWEVELTGETTWTIVGLASLTVNNTSEQTIAHLYIASPEDESWGEDWLGDVVIDPGEEYTIGGIPPGTYDIKVTDTDNNAIEVVYNVELAGTQRWTVMGMAPLPENAVLRFEDDFSDNRNNWGRNEETDEVLYMTPADGQYCILIKGANLTAWEWYEPFRTDQFVAEVACTISGAEDASCGLGFGPDGDNLYWFEVSPSNQTLALFLLEHDEWQDNLIDWSTSKNISPVGKNYLSMQRVEGVVSLYVNGVLAGEVESDRFPTGRVGIGGSTYGGGSATICLDDLRVWRLE